GGAGGLVQDCLITKNTSGIYGGGIDIEKPGTIERCRITDNSAAGGGGIGSLNGSSGTIRNCLMAHNAAGDGGGLYLGGTYTVENNTIVDNSAGDQGGGAYNYSGSSVLRNNIIYHNSAARGINVQGAFVQSSSCIWPLSAGAGNISNAPAFIDRATRDYHLSTASDCVNAGANQGWMSGGSDLEGSARIANGLVDIGAYELSTNIPLLRVSSTLVDFGQIFVNAMKQLPLVVRNAGGSVLTGSAGAVAYPFALMSPPSFVLGVNATNTIIVKFEPEDEGVFTAALPLSGGGDATVTLRGATIPEPALLLLPLLLLGSGFRVQEKR
ncbi:MAG: right-handed parallel beta-helix repeat-containing protein, partial [bacterium]|nr:right-handed parallel beta-helix repeat-containing protein [bacterium]